MLMLAELRRMLWMVIALVLAGTVFAQEKDKDGSIPLPALSGRGILDQLGGGGGGADGEHVAFSGEYRIAKGARDGELSVKAKIEPGWHIYSTTQKSGGPTRSRLKVAPSQQYTITSPFVADRPPHIKQEEVFPVPSEEYGEEVVWTASFQASEGANLEQLKFDVRYDGQVCQDGGVCLILADRQIPVSFTGLVDAPSVGTFQPKRVHAVVRGEISPRIVPPGGTVRVTLTAEPTAEYHVYAYAERDESKISKPTLIAWKNDQGWKRSSVRESEPPIDHPTGLADEPIQYYYEGSVDWTIELQVPEDATPAGYELRGLLGFQTCTDATCDAPTAVEFHAVVEVSPSPAESSPQPLRFTSASYATVAKLADSSSATAASPAAPTVATDAGTESTSTAGESDRSESAVSDGHAGPLLDLSKLEPVGSVDAKQSIFVVLPMAFLAGFILNFMPCVLPVIGLKIVSFVNQAGQSRAQIFMLNLWFSIGLMSVFMILASLAVFFGFSWGEQFQSATFNIVLASVVFAFALSFLGVWEIPVPGFVGTSKANKVAEKEGPVGAVFKGILTTVLATPCSGPLLVPALAWAVKQSPPVTFASFACVGLGMAFPYLVVGAFPRLISFLPKPGVWMETFKQLMGFVLLGTVVFILTYIPIPLVVPTVAFMMGLWVALWCVGRVPVWDDLNKRIRAWAVGLAIGAAIGMLSFSWLDDIMAARFQRDVDAAIASSNTSSTPIRPVRTDGAAKPPGPVTTELDWKPYSLALLSKYVLSDKKAVFVDFTADW